MAVPEPNDLERLIRKVRKKYGKQDRWGELKFYNPMDPTREPILEGVADMDRQIAWVALDKSRPPSAWLSNKHLVYMTACEVVLPELFRRASARRMNIMMDKYYSKRWERDELEERVGSLLIKDHAGYLIPQYQVSQYDPLSSKELQVHDLVVGAIYQYAERNVDTYIDIIKNKIVFGREY